MSTGSDCAELLPLYRQMWRIRAFESAVLDCIKRGLITGGPHLYIGEEAVAVGVCATLHPSDYITSTHRGHGHCIAKGGELKPMMAELFTKATGYCQGKGGTMHIADIDLGILGANGIVGAGLPIGVGAALSARLKGEDRVVACFFGDAASNTGAFHESLNLAAVWRLPVVFVCENNLFGMFTPLGTTTPVADVAVRAQSYGIQGTVVDGNDVIAVREAADAAVERARSGGGPTLLECKTYRQLGHFVGDPERYREASLTDQWRLRDPLVLACRQLLEGGVVSEADDRQIQEEVRREVEEAVAYAVASPQPAPEALLEGLYLPFYSDDTVRARAMEARIDV
ncbi:MAG: thiamine pyrophosphate-dependent dehydrogenase E1 component subunit alpha [Dehalococcoidales bacterium]|nr:thiamine pyrophosphate-dependent dehydrogenase E1 component subunit alpha [Dehalococcoidales bacterium]